MQFRWFLITVLVTATSCVSVKEFQQLQSNVRQLQENVQDVKRSEAEHGRLMERSFRDVISHLECPNDEVRKLVAACVLAKNECSPADIERAVSMMTKMRHVMGYYRPGQRPGQMPPERLALLSQLIQGHKRTINTKILLLVLPYAATDAKASEEAELLGSDYREFVQKHASSVRNDGPMRIIDPKIIGCERSQELIRKYEGEKNDRPISGEPTSRERRTVLWTFMVDC